MAAIHVCNVAAITACVSESACLGLLLPCWCCGPAALLVLVLLLLLLLLPCWRRPAALLPG